MKLHHSPTSPFVRKVMVVALERGLALEVVPTSVHPVTRNRDLIAANPLGQVPTLITDDGIALHDSRVICEYLDALATPRLFPPAGPARWRALVEQSLADGLLAAALLIRYEAGRPDRVRWQDWSDGQADKLRTVLDRFEQDAAQLGDRVDIGTISIACALGYLDLRFPELGWRDSRPALAGWFAAFAARPAMQATEPEA